MTSALLATKDVDTVVEENDESGLKRAVGALDLTALGLGAIIGTGIFVIIGEAIGDSGPRSSCRSSWPGLTCIFSALSYAELASAIPVSGSAYTYSYATMGELVAWIIGWDLILEYGAVGGRDRRRLGRVLQRPAGLGVRDLAAGRDRAARPARAAPSTSPPCS